MTELRITPNEASKKLAIEGRIAAGEHIQLTLVGYASKATDSELRLRVLFGDKTVAMFPLLETDSWTIEGDNATCVLNLNTDRAAKLLKFGGECMWVLDDTSLHTLYGMKEHYVGAWPREVGTDIPYNLDSFKDKIEELEKEISSFENGLRTEWDAYVAKINMSLADKVDTSTFNSHLNNYNNPHQVTKAQVGLGNVDNTADSDKPVSTAQRIAINEEIVARKEAISTLEESLQRVETTLNEKISNEVSTARSEEKELEEQIETEASNREAQDIALHNELHGWVDTFTKNLETEANKREGADTSLQNSCASLSVRLMNEVEDRKNADDGISRQLASKLNKVTTGLDEIGTKYTLKDVKNKLNEIVAILKGEA